MPLDWRQITSTMLRTEREGRTLEVTKHTDGTWRLFVWKGGASAIAGSFHDYTVACLAGEHVPLDDASLAKLAAKPTAFLGEVAEACVIVTPASEMTDAERAARVSPLRSICCYIGTVPTFRCPDCPHGAT